MLKELIKIANELDNRGLAKEADYLDGIIRKMAEDYTEEDFMFIVYENYDIGNGYNQITIKSPDGLSEQKYIYETEGMSDLNPGSTISETRLDELMGSTFLGEGGYQDPAEFHINDLPSDAKVITAISSGQQTKCYFKLNDGTYKEIVGPYDLNCWELE